MSIVQSDKRARAIELRLQGKSYGEIMKVLNIPSKGTISYWLSSTKLPSRAKKRLQHNIELAQKRGLFAFNKRRTQSIHLENKAIFQESSQEITSVSKKELLLVGSALYWAEGVNRETVRGYRTIAFTNSDPKLVKVFMRYLRDALNVGEDDLKPGIIIYPNLNPQLAKDFWARITNIPKEKFWVTVAISKASKRKKPSNYLPYGTFHLRVNKRQFFYKIQGYIAGITKQLQ